MKCFGSVSSGGCWRGVEICTSQVVALLLRRGPNPSRPVQPGSQPKVVLLPGAPHQILSDTSLQSQKPPPYQWAGTGNAKIPDQGKTLMCESINPLWAEFWYIFLIVLLNRSLSFYLFWTEPEQVFMTVLAQFFSNLLFFLLHSFLFFTAMGHIEIFAPR